ncbi:MAG: MIP/aquaporin family protein [Herpetosiphon sp.]
MNKVVVDLASRDTQKAALAELVGTFFLTIAALHSGAPFAVALTLTAFVYGIGNISGCQINPAVTVALITTKRVPLIRGMIFIVAQVLGAVLARLIAGAIGPVAPALSATLFGEFFGVGFLILTVLSVSQGFVPDSGSGIAIGTALLAGLLTTGGVLNPAVAVAAGQLLTPAVFATLIAGVAFALLFNLYKRPDKKSRDPKPTP